MVLYSEWVFGGVFKIFIRRFVGFLFYFSLLNVCKIKLLELVFGFCGGCVRLGVQIYTKIRLNHWEVCLKNTAFL